MKRLFSLHTMFFFVFGSVIAQTKDSTYNFTIQQAIEFAYEHQANSLKARLDEQIADAKVKEIKAAGLPQISGSFDVKDFVELPTSVVPATFFDKNAPANQLYGIQFGTRFTAVADLSASQLIFDPTYFVGLQAARTIRDLSQKNTMRSKIDVAVAVSKAYYNVLVSNARMGLIDANVERLEKLHSDTKAMYENGFVEKIDFNRVTLAYNNAKTEKENVERLLDLSNSVLKYQVGITLNSKINLMDSLNASQVKNFIVPAEQPDVSKRIEYSILQTTRELHYLDAKRYKQGYIPSIFAYGDINTSGYRLTFDIFEGGRIWYPSGLFGAKLTWNLFDGMQKRRQAQQATLEMKKTEVDMEDMQNGLNLETLNSKATLQNALVSLTTQEQNLELANEVSSVTRIKYEQGVGSNTEVIDAETSLKEAQTNYYNALYGALVAKVDLDKSLGNIK